MTICSKNLGDGPLGPRVYAYDQGSISR